MWRLLEKMCLLVKQIWTIFSRHIRRQDTQAIQIQLEHIFLKRLYCVQTVRHHVNIRLTDKKFHSHQTKQTAQSHRWQSHVGLAPITKKHARQIARKLRAAKRKKMGTHDSINKVCSQFGQKTHTQTKQTSLSTTPRQETKEEKTLRRITGSSKTCASSARRAIAIAESL